MKPGPDNAARAMARANPVPDPHAFADTMTRADVFLTNLELREYMDTMERTPARDEKKQPRGARWVALTSIAAVAIVVVGTAILSFGDTAAPPASAIGVADAFVEARSAGDADAALALLADDAEISEEPANDAESYANLLGLFEAVGWRWTLTECVAGTPTIAGATERLECGYDHGNAWNRANGITSFEDHGTFIFEIHQGLIMGFSHVPEENSSFAGDSSFSTNAWGPFVKWVYANHPDAAGQILSDGCCTPAITPEAVSTWRTLTNAYVAEVSG